MSVLPIFSQPRLYKPSTSSICRRYCPLKLERQFIARVNWPSNADDRKGNQYATAIPYLVTSEAGAGMFVSFENENVSNALAKSNGYSYHKIYPKLTRENG